MQLGSTLSLPTRKPWKPNTMTQKQLCHRFVEMISLSVKRCFERRQIFIPAFGICAGGRDLKTSYSRYLQATDRDTESNYRKFLIPFNFSENNRGPASITTDDESKQYIFNQELKTEKVRGNCHV